jgi:hypothetical protein
MKEFVQHPVLGEIVYDESIWTGKKTLTVNGETAKTISKNIFEVNGKTLTISGSILTGIKLFTDDETIEISPKPKWYEIALAILPFVFLMTWGNSPALCAIFPVVGGAIGGALGGLSGVISLLFMKKEESPAKKVLIGVIALVATVLVAFLLALGLVSLLV